MNKRPKFFCESCGTEVKQNDKFCFHCGKFFSSVKCPSCGFSGESQIFRSGCPLCGYAVHLDGRQTMKNNPGGRAKRKKPDIDPLPWWIYLVSIALFALFIVFILFQK